MDISDGKSGGGGNVYKGSMELVLVSLSNSYSNDDKISVSDSRYSSYPTYTDTDYFTLLTTALKKCIRCCPKKDVLL